MRRAARGPARPLAHGKRGCAEAARLAGAPLDTSDPLAVSLTARRRAAAGGEQRLGRDARPAPQGTVAVRAPMQGTIVDAQRRQGDVVRAGRALLVMNAMKMEHVVDARRAAASCARSASARATRVSRAQPLVFIEDRAKSRRRRGRSEAARRSRHVRPDLAEVLARHACDARRGAAGGGGARGARPASARRARTSPISAIPAASSSTAALAIAAQRRAAPSTT